MRLAAHIGVSPKTLRAKITQLRNSFNYGTPGFTIAVSCFLLLTAFIFVGMCFENVKVIFAADLLAGAIQELLTTISFSRPHICQNTGEDSLFTHFI